MSVNSFLMSLTTPPRVHISYGDELADLEGLAIDGIPVEHGYPKWLGFPDILYDEKSKTLGAFVFPTSGDLELARRMCVLLDGGTIQFRDSRSVQARDLYVCDDETWLEIILSQMEKPAYVPAQLAEVHFYFPVLYKNEDAVRPIIAFEVFHISDTLSQFDLVLPDLTEFPRLPISYNAR
jgi:hypothetical protein